MGKPKTITKNNQTYLQLRSEKGQQVNLHDLDIMTTRPVEGLLPFSFSPAGKQHLFTYTTTGLITLASFLRLGMRKHQFAALLDHVVKTLKTLQEAYFNPGNILLDHNLVFVNPTTRKISFAYIPIQFFKGDVPLKEFYLGFAFNTVFSQNENPDYVQEYIKILNRGINFSMFDLEEYIRRIKGSQKEEEAKSRCKRCSAFNTRSARFCLSCGSPMQQELIAGGSVYMPQDAQQAAIKTPADAESAPVHHMMDACLIREKTKEVFNIDKSVFRIGKSEDSDCVIADNGAVSRNHAEILSKEDGLFLVDLLSTNKTFVDGKAVAPRQEVPLLSGMTLCFANENFEFRIQGATS